MVGDFVLVFLLVGGGLLMLYLQSVRRDHQDAERKHAETESAARREQAAAEEEARKYQPGVRLRCLGCETRFPGPLSDLGCPQCHLLSLIVVEET